MFVLMIALARSDVSCFVSFEKKSQYGILSLYKEHDSSENSAVTGTTAQLLPPLSPASGKTMKLGDALYGFHDNLAPIPATGQTISLVEQPRTLTTVSSMPEIWHLSTLQEAAFAFVSVV